MPTHSPEDTPRPPCTQGGARCPLQPTLESGKPLEGKVVIMDPQPSKALPLGVCTRSACAADLGLPCLPGVYTNCLPVNRGVCCFSSRDS